MSDEPPYPAGMGCEHPVEPHYFEFSEYGFPGTGATLIWDASRQELRIKDYYDEVEESKFWYYSYRYFLIVGGEHTSIFSFES